MDYERFLKYERFLLLTKFERRNIFGVFKTTLGMNLYICEMLSFLSKGLSETNHLACARNRTLTVGVFTSVTYFLI